MAIFHHKVLQSIVNRLVQILIPTQLKNLVYKVNKNNENALAFEWELVLLDVLSKAGRVFYEKEFNGVRPDICLSISDAASTNLVAEVTTVSDSGRLYESLVDKFRKRFREEAGKQKLDPQKFSWELNVIREGVVLDDYFCTELIGFLERASKNNKQVSIETELVKLQYHPSTQSRSRSWTKTSYTKPTNNPFYNALQAKRKKLKKIPQIPKGIVLCDGGSEMFFFTKSDPIYLGSDDVIRHFLSKNGEVSFVLTVWVDRERIEVDGHYEYRIRCALFEGASFSQLDVEAQKFLRKIKDHFPRSIATPDVVLSCILNNTISESFGYGVIQIGKD